MANVYKAALDLAREQLRELLDKKAAADQEKAALEDELKKLERVILALLQKFLIDEQIEQLKKAAYDAGYRAALEDAAKAVEPFSKFTAAEIRKLGELRPS